MTTLDALRAEVADKIARRDALHAEQHEQKSALKPRLKTVEHACDLAVVLALLADTVGLQNDPALRGMLHDLSEATYPRFRKDETVALDKRDIDFGAPRDVPTGAPHDAIWAHDAMFAQSAGIRIAVHHEYHVLPKIAAALINKTFADHNCTARVGEHANPSLEDIADIPAYINEQAQKAADLVNQSRAILGPFGRNYCLLEANFILSGLYFLAMQQRDKEDEAKSPRKEFDTIPW